MNVLFVASWWPTDDSPVNGIFIKEHAQAISRFAKIIVVHFEQVKKIPRLGNFPFGINVSIKKENGIDSYIFTIKVSLRRFGLYRYSVNKAMKKVLNDLNEKYSFDIININVLRNEFSERIIEENLLPGIPVVITEHSTFYHTEINLLPKPDQIKTKRRLINLLGSNKIKCVMPVSYELGKVLIDDYKLNNKRVKIIPNVANELFSYKKKQNTEEKIKIALIASWHGSKNPLLFLKALAILEKNYLRKIEIDWIGEGIQMSVVKEFYFKNLKDEVIIIFKGYQTKEQIASVLQESDFLVHPTDAENLPCIIIESLSSGLPVLSNSVNGVTELIDSTNGILSPKQDELSFANNLKLMIDNCRNYNRFELAEVARNKFSKEVVGSKIYSVYKEVLKEETIRNDGSKN